MAAKKKSPSLPVVKQSFCCERFADCVQRGEIGHAEHSDETEWYVEGWVHLYYCPFCGRHIKGKGVGTYDEEHGVASRPNRTAQD